MQAHERKILPRQEEMIMSEGLGFKSQCRKRVSHKINVEEYLDHRLVLKFAIKHARYA